MASEEKPLSEFPRALQVAEQALVMISNPDGLGGYDTNGALLTEVGRAILAVQYTQQLGNVSVFDAIKNTRVLSGTTTPTAIEGANGQLYVKYETVSNVDTVIGMYFKKDGAWLEISLGGGGNTDYIECTQAQYDAWEQAGTLDPDTLYFITDGQAGGSSTLAGLSDVDITSPADGQLLRYNGTSGKWENAGVDSLGSNSLNTTDQTIVGAINELNTLSAVSFSSNAKLTNNGINVVKYGKFILFVGVFRGTTLNANETIFQLNNVNIISVINTVFIPISGNFSSNYVGYLKAENSGTGIKIYTDVALDNSSLLFVNGIIPIS